jgi:hypothetical protein
MILAQRCAICNSSRWCGRPCKNAPKAETSVINAPSPNTSPNKVSRTPAKKAKSGGYARNAKWRDAKRDKYNLSQRDLMRKKRAAEKHP